MEKLIKMLFVFENDAFDFFFARMLRRTVEEWAFRLVFCQLAGKMKMLRTKWPPRG